MSILVCCHLSCIPVLHSNLQCRHRQRRRGAPLMAASMNSDAKIPNKSTKLVTFLGKGGSGKTTAAVLAAHYFAMEGLRTCLVIHSQDPTAEHLIGQKIGDSLTPCSENLSAVRLHTSKMILEPLDRMKKVDARLNLTQGVLEGVVGEELGVLPGMDSIFSVLALQKFVNFLPNQRNASKEDFDVVVYDGISSEETVRLIGATERARWYLKYARNMAEKTEIGRLTAPSILKLAYESVMLNRGSSEGKTSTDIWNEIEQMLEQASTLLADPSKLACYLVADPSHSTSVSAALRYWGCAIQAGANIRGALGFASESSLLPEEVPNKFSPLALSILPYISLESSIDWASKIRSLDQDAKDVFATNSTFQDSVIFDATNKSVTLFLPGFEKSEIKLYQYQGGAELLVEAGDQRRIIKLPREMQGKVGGAKFIERNLVVTLR